MNIIDILLHSYISPLVNYHLRNHSTGNVSRYRDSHANIRQRIRDHRILNPKYDVSNSYP